ncbi:MAG: homoserine kinase [Bacteroidetes bacterium]|nr:MAG: homoserine kinase [Bacteroidota bacterium]
MTKPLAEVRVFAPATVANVAVGFDILGFALEQPGDQIVVRFAPAQKGLKISTITGTGEKRLPLDPEKNTAGFAALQLLRYLDRVDLGIEMEIHKQMPFSSGLGSSAASAAAGVFAVNELLGSPLKKLDLLRFAVEGEEIADGAFHADNVAPSLLGGITFIRDNRSLDVHQLPIPADLHAAVVYPFVEIRTKDARDALSKDTTLKTTITQTGNLGALLIGLYESDYGLIARALQDVLIEPQRAHLIPGFYEVQEAALRAGALGSSISGAGPSVFALCQGAAKAQAAAVAMQATFQRQGIASHNYVSPINTRGAVRL